MTSLTGSSPEPLTPTPEWRRPCCPTLERAFAMYFTSTSRGARLTPADP
ncbi:hypothetical protein BG846_01245 [Streptomyces fradiae ATCC 10745 = DSM 40063]|uniref:Uncharacterized protein n=1 Tax=Streptomyces fradiae ATCC 10745 = DSM 40063 TaxID=1319510 RepID=A0A1Y2P1M9_STRFR|nr:hypothetical protein BG846_01245 [Streptomyces fradiae ATCC 10745 = DSM 40063]